MHPEVPAGSNPFVLFLPYLNYAIPNEFSPAYARCYGPTALSVWWLYATGGINNQEPFPFLGYCLGFSAKICAKGDEWLIFPLRVRVINLFMRLQRTIQRLS